MGRPQIVLCYIFVLSICITLVFVQNQGRILINKLIFRMSNGKEPKRSFLTNGNPETSMINDRVNVMLFGYARGGSSYVGEMLGLNDNTFFVFEPFWTTEDALHYYRDKYICEMNSKNCSYNIKIDIHKHKNKLHSMFGCRDNVFPELHWLEINGKSKNLQGYKIKCLKTKIHVAKVLRLTAEILEDLLLSDEKLKIVYLYRDPRGIINSRMKLRKFKHWNITIGTVKSIADGLCYKMDLDSKIVFNLKDLYPKRIILIAYETIVNDPKTSLNKLFLELGISISKKYLQKISKLGNIGNATENWHSTSRRNGTATAYQWKQHLSSKDRKTIDETCDLVYKRLGYSRV